MRELVEQVVEGHKNTKEAKAKLWAYKQRIGIGTPPSGGPSVTLSAPPVSIYTNDVSTACRRTHSKNLSFGAHTDRGVSLSWYCEIFIYTHTVWVHSSSEKAL